MSSKDLNDKILAQINYKPSLSSSRNSPRLSRPNARRSSSTNRSQVWSERSPNDARRIAESSLTIGAEDGGCIACFRKGWSPNWGNESRIALMLFVTITSIYVVIYWVIYASKLDHRPGLFMSFTCILLAIALLVTVATAKKLWEMFSHVNIEVKSPPSTPMPVTEVWGTIRIKPRRTSTEFVSEFHRNTIDLQQQRAHKSSTCAWQIVKKSVISCNINHRRQVVSRDNVCMYCDACDS